MKVLKVIQHLIKVLQMNVRDQIDYNSIKEVDKIVQSAFNKAILKISRLNLDDLKDVQLTENIIKTEFDNVAILISDTSYESAKKQYYNSIRTSQSRLNNVGLKYQYNFNATDKTMLDILDSGNSLYLNKLYDDKMQGVIADKLKEIVTGEKLVKNIKSELSTYLNLTSKKAVSSIANMIVTTNTTTRSIATTNMLERAGATKYKYLVVLDNVTTGFCRALAGKTVEVKDAVQLRNKIINIPRNDVDVFQSEIDRISPMMEYDEETGLYYKQSDKKKLFKPTWNKDTIMNIPGIQLPPFHQYCRTEIGIVS